MDHENTTSYIFPTNLFELVVSAEQEPLKPILIISCIVSACAAATNGLSLSYFLQRGHRGLGNKLLIFLNLLDLIYCIFMSISVCFYFITLGKTGDQFIKYQAAYLKINGFTYVLEEGTGYATLLLSVTRCISMYSPFYRMKNRPIVHASIAFFVYLLTKNTICIVCFEISHPICQKLSEEHLKFAIGCEMMCIIFIVLVTNVVAVVKLHTTPTKLGQETPNSNRNVTITVVALSAVFCCLNLFKYSVVIAARVTTDFRFATLYNVAIYVAIPLNSALNPVVYIVRTSSMRRYAVDLFINGRLHYRISRIHELVSNRNSAQDGNGEILPRTSGSSDEGRTIRNTRMPEEELVKEITTAKSITNDIKINVASSNV